jgi:hypothetical protein
MKLDFLDRLSKNIQTKFDFKNIRPVGKDLFQADRQTDTTKVIVAFRNSANARRNIQLIQHRKMKALCSDTHPKQINARCGQDVVVLGAYGNLRKATIGFVMPTCLSVRIELGPTGRNSIIFHIYFFEYLKRKVKNSLKYDNNEYFI